MDDATFESLKANYTPYNIGTKKKTSGRGGPATAFVSEAGGLAGAAKGATLGAAAGTAIMPGVGTVIGGILGGAAGGFLGGTAGKALENKIRDDEYRIKEALGEGVSSGISGAIGGGFAGKAATATAKGATKAASASRVTKFGEGLKRTVINPQVKASPFAATEQAEIVKIMSKVPGTNAQAKLQNLPTEFNKINTQLNSVLQANTKTATRTSINNIIKTKSGDIPQFVGGDKAYRAALQTELKDLGSKFAGNKITPAQIQAAKSNIASKMDGIFGRIAKGSDLNPKEASRLAIWQGLDDQIIKLAPEAKQLTLTQSGFYKAAPGILKASQKTAGLPIIGVKSSGLESALQSVKYTTGEALTGAGAVASKIPKLGPVAKTMLPAQAMRGLGAAQEPTLEDALMQQGGFNETPWLENGISGPLDQQTREPVQTSPYPRENLLYDLQRDPQNADKYMEYYQTMESVFGAPEAPKMAATERQRAQNAQSGIRSLGTLEETLMNDPGAFQRQSLPNPLGITARITGTSEVRAATDNIIDVIARLRSGAAITDSEAARFARLLPQAGDSQESARYKLDMVRAELENVASGGASAPSTLEDLLMQQGAM